MDYIVTKLTEKFVVFFKETIWEYMKMCLWSYEQIWCMYRENIQHCIRSTLFS